MRKFTSIFNVRVVFLLFVVTTAAFCLTNTFNRSEKNSEYAESEENEGEKNGKEMYNEAAMRQHLEFERTKDPALGYVPKDRLIAAYNATEHSKQIAMRSRITTGTWIERGPKADEVGTNNNNPRDGGAITSGRMRALWVDLADPTGNTVWVGGIGGGLWKTTNFKTWPATWAPVNDFFTNMAVGSICQDPTNTNTMYFGTGERTFNSDAIRGGGVWKSTDNGVNWTLLAVTSSYYNVSKLLCDAAGNLYVGTIVSNTGGGSSGLFRSTNGGTSFTNISPNGIDSRISDFVISSTGRFHVATGYYNSASPGYRYTDNPGTVASNSWTSGSGFPSTLATNANCVLACKGDTLYAMPSTSSWTTPTIYKSVNGGANWAATTGSPTTAGNAGLNGNSPQGWYCIGIDVNPTDAQNVIIGSLNCYGTTDGGATWTQRSDWAANAGSTNQYVHADIQIVKWFANNQVLIGTDGGIFYSQDAGVSFQDRNSGLNIKQFYSCAFHPTLTDYFLAGAQDNGCHQFTTPGLNSTIEVSGGDGAFVHIDQDEPAYQFVSYVRNRFRRSTNSGDNWSQINFYKGTSGSPVDFGSFINTSEYDNAANIMYSGADARELFRWSTAQTTPATPVSPSNNYLGSGFPAGANILAIGNLRGRVSAITVSPYTPNLVYVGTDTARLLKISNANTFVSGSGATNTADSLYFPANSTISCIAVGTDDNNLMVTFSNYGVNNIWITTNGGTTWTAIDGNLPDMPVRWAVFDPSSNTKAWIATETGVWSTTAINGGSTVWAASPGFPTVRTDMIKYRAADQNLVAATHGRGLWTQSQASVLPINTFVLRGKWKNNSVELAWDYSNATAAAMYEIESSTNGTYFTKVGTPQFNTTYLDQPGITDIYYRVKGKNILGNISYSNVIHLKKGVEIRDIAAINIFPNPVRTNMKISFAASGNGLAQYRITATSGQVCWKKEEEISATGEYIREWNMQTLKPGTYLFTIVYNNKRITKKFVKL